MLITWRRHVYRHLFRSYASVSSSSTTKHSNTTIPQHADVIVCGAGIVGLSVAYHLADKLSNVIVFDRDWYYF